ncbi:MAG TPA: ABC transporter ATP-binding protein [Anaerolineales bacterium]|nr:ABC transporter ATP-binding protein [Anaerolineales bacterium]
MINKHDSTRSNSQPEILVAEGLRKSYGPRKALQGLTFSLKAGRILGFLGPNGAGKTTSIRILTTMMEPEAGRFVIDGISSEYPEQIRRRIGVLPENLGFPRQMTGLEYLIYFGQLYGRTASEAKENALTLLADVGLQQRAKSLIGSYSHGMRQRIGIARALVNDPVVVFLDEPTLGLDPRGQAELLELVQRIAHERNTGVVLCSHLLSEIENVCDDVVILNLGQIVARGSVAEVIGRVQQNIVLQNALRVHIPAGAAFQARQILEAMPNIINVTSIGESEGELRLELMSRADGNLPTAYQANNKILGALIRAKIPILGFEVEGGSLQDVFLHLTEESIK